MAQANSSPAQDDLSDVTPSAPQGGGSPQLSPWLLVQAQKEKAAMDQDGTPPPVGGAIHTLGKMASQFMPPERQAFHAENAGILPPGTTKAVQAAKMQTQQVKPNPVGQMPVTQAAVNTAPGAGQIGPPAPQQAGTAGPQFTPEQIQQLQALKQEGLKPQMSMAQEVKQTDGTTGKQLVGAAPGVFTRGYQEAEANSQPSQSAIDKLTAMAQANANRPKVQPQPDLSGLMMAADFLNKTNTFGKDYDSQKASAQAQQEEQEKQSQQEFQNEAAAVKEQLDLENQKRQTALGIMGGGSAGSAGNIVNTVKEVEDLNKQTAGQTTAQNQFMNHVQTIFKPIQDDETEANKVTSLVNSHNPAAISGIKEALTRLMTGARPQMALIASQAQDPSLGQRMESYMNLASNGQLPVENIAQMNQMVADINKVSNGRRAVATQQLHGFGDSIGMDRGTQDSMIPPLASPSLSGQATHGGAQSIKVQQGKAAANQSGMVTMYKGGQAFQVPRANVVKAQGRGYSMDKQ